MVKHINIGLGGFIRPLIQQLGNREIRTVIANRLNVPEYYVHVVLDEVCIKVERREYLGLEPIPEVIPYDEITRHYCFLLEQSELRFAGISH